MTRPGRWVAPAVVACGAMAASVGGLFWKADVWMPMAPDMMVRAGTIAEVSGAQLTLSDADGRDYTFDVARNATITLDAVSARMDDLKAGYPAQVTADRGGDAEVARAIEARTRK